MSTEKSTQRIFSPVRSEALVRAMANVGPAHEWAWFDYISPGDVLRVVKLRAAIYAADTATDVRASAIAALAEIQRVALGRMSDIAALAEVKPVALAPARMSMVVGTP